MKRRLALKSEYVSELTTNELASIAGGATYGCFTGYYPTINAPCPTVDDCIAVGAIPSVNSPCPTDGCFTGTTTHTMACS